MPEDPGFEIKHPEAKEGRFYSWPASFRLGDTVLIEKVTGLSWPEFVERVPEDDDEIPEMAGTEDMVVLIGLMAAGIWQAHPSWRRDKVVQYVERLDQDRVKFIGGGEEEPAEEGDERPPEVTEAAAGATTSETSPPPSTTAPALSSDEPNPSSSGDPTSPTGPDSASSE